MREYTNYPKNIENNNNISTEVKKPKLYLVTSKIVNLFAIFVASISVSTFFATRYIGIGDIFFSANIFSTMLSVAIFIVILEIYGRKNALKAFMAGAYAILLVFFISAFITDFNPTPIGYYQSSFINFHQTVLLSVFVAYVVSFLACIRVYLYMKDDLDLPYLWVKAVPTIAVSQILYTICYYLIYHGFSNLDVVALAVKNELYLKFFMMIISLLVIYFIISGIKSGFFDIFKNSFGSKNVRYIDTYEHNPIKSIYDAKEDAKELSSHSTMALGDYRSHRPEEQRVDYRDDHREDSPRRSRRSLPDYSENARNYDPRSEFSGQNYHPQNNEPQYESGYKQIVEEDLPNLRRSRRSAEATNNQEAPSSNRSSSNRRTNRKAVRGSAKTSSARVRNVAPAENVENFEGENQASNNIARTRDPSNSKQNRPTINSRPAQSSGQSRQTTVVPRISGINQSAGVNNFGQQNNQSMGNQFPNQMGGQNPSFAKGNKFGGTNNFAKPSSMMQNKSNPFGNNNGNNNNFGNNNSFGNKVGQQNNQSFFANKLNSNNKPAGMSGGFGNANKNNIWTKR